MVTPSDGDRRVLDVVTLVSGYGYLSVAKVR